MSIYFTIKCALFIETYSFSKALSEAYIRLPGCFSSGRFIRQNALNCSCTTCLYGLDFILFYGVEIYGDRFGLQLICPYQVRLELISTNLFAAWTGHGHKPRKAVLVPHFTLNCQRKHPHSYCFK